MPRMSVRFRNIEVTGDPEKNGFGVKMGQKPDYRGCGVSGRKRQDGDGTCRRILREL